MSYYTKITKAGLAAISSAMNNSSKVPITYMAFGDGNGSIPEPNENSSSLVNEVYRVGVNKVEVHNKNPNWLVCEAIIPSAVGGFNIREVALYDNTGTTMLAIASYPPTYKPSINEGAAKIQTIRIIIQVDNTGDFELIIDPDVVLATKAMVDEITKDKASQFQTIDDLKNNYDTNIKQAFVAEYSLNTSTGGGEFFADFDDHTSLENGVTVFVAANGTRWKRKNKSLKFSDAGCTGGSDDTVGLKRIFNFLKTNGGTIEDFSGQTFSFNEKIDCIAPNKKITIKTNCKLVSSNTFITISGNISEVSYLTSPVSKNSLSAQLNSVEGLNANSIIAIVNTRPGSFNKIRDYYFDGEIKEIQSISGNVINFKQPLESTYPAGIEDKIYKIDPVILNIDGMITDCNGLAGLQIRMAAESTFNLETYNKNNIGIASYGLIFDRVYKSKMTGGKGVKLGIGSTGTDYGIIASNCQDLLIEADYAFGARHGGAMGGGDVPGAIPNRRVYFEKAIIDSDKTIGLHTADIHGNAESCHYKDCAINGLIGLGGSNVSSYNNKITVTPGETRPPVFVTEPCGKIASIGDTIIDSADATFIMGFASSQQASLNTKPYSFELRDVKIKNTKVTALMSAFSVNGSDNSFIIDGFEFENVPTTLIRLMSYAKLTDAKLPSYIQITRPLSFIPNNVLTLYGDAVLPNVPKQVFSSSGRNSNGSWIKQSDGSMICRHRVTATLPFKTPTNGGFKTPNIQWTFPEAFVEQPTVIAMSYDNTSFSIRSESAGTSSSQLYSVCPVEVESAGVNFDVIAIGKFLR